MNMDAQTDLFIQLCYDGKFSDAIQLLSENPNIDISANDNEAFTCACLHKHLHIAKWLYKINPTMNISVKNENAFRWACLNGNIEIAQWLLSIKPTINIYAKDEFAFKQACENGHLNIVQWLFPLRNNQTLNLLSTSEEGFILACGHGHLEIAQWLLSIEPAINISSHNHKAFKMAGFNSKINVAQWLQSLCPDIYVLVFKNNQLIKFEVIGSMPFTQNTIKLPFTNKEDMECPICYEQVEVQTNCGHNFCASCITNYYNKCNTDCKCPYCRQPVTKFTKIMVDAINIL